MPYLPVLSTHSGRLERWLGPQAEVLSAMGKGWYGPPIPLIGVPGGVYLRGGEHGGDFVGPIEGGYFGNLYDFACQRMRAALRRTGRRSVYTTHAGFSSLGDLIAEATSGGKKRIFIYNKTGVTGVTGSTSSLWYEGSTPAAGMTAAGAPAGTAHVSSDTGGFSFSNPSGTDSQHFTRWDSWASVASNTLLLYDRLFAVEKTMNSTATEAVTGVPTRYQNTGSGADSAAGNFLFIECRATLSGVAHNWTVCEYTDQNGNTGVSLPSVTGNSGCIAKRLDMPTQTWFCPLDTGDTGILNITQMQCSANIVAGNIAFVIGHPIAVLAHPIINMVWTLDGVTGAFNLNRIFDDACLAFLELMKPSAAATTYSGTFETVSG